MGLLLVPCFLFALNRSKISHQPWEMTEEEHEDGGDKDKGKVAFFGEMGDSLALQLPYK